MKVLGIALFIFVSVSAKGSGPYLPSGWRPTGPSFLLPSEVQKPAPLEDVVFENSEASGSEALREYGPPVQESVQKFNNQGLPDVDIVHNFITESEVKEVGKIVEEVVETSVDNAEVQSSPVIAQVLEATTDSLISAAEQSTNVETDVQTVIEEITTGFSNGVEAVKAEFTQTEVTTATEEPLADDVALTEYLNEPTTAVNVLEKDNIENIQDRFVANEQIIVLTEPTTESVTYVEIAKSELSNLRVELAEQFEKVKEKILEPIVQNIPEVIASLDNEVQSNQVEVTQVSSVQESSGSLEQTPEGFLEYGPPGFSEYGPPKQNQLARDVATDNTNSNEVRRRRFSPKFKPTRKAH